MKILNYWKPVLVALVILYGSLTSSANISKVNFLHFNNSDKFIHAVLYFTLALSFITALYKNTKLKKFDLYLLSFLLVKSYGILMEVFQYSLTKDRSPELLDLLANLTGIVIALILFAILKNKKIIRYL